MLILGHHHESPEDNVASQQTLSIVSGFPIHPTPKGADEGRNSP